MAKSITFSVKLNVDGKEQLVAATADVKNLREAVRSMDSPMQGLLKQFNNWGFAFQNISGAANGIASSLNSLTAESRSFGGAMAAANTMAGKGGEDFSDLKTQVAELSKTIPVARDQLANGLYQVISNGVPEDNWIEYLEKSAKASVGGIANLEEVVKVTSTVIKNYGLAWDDAGTIQDKIQLTAKNGVTSFEQMAQALPRVTANASTLGVSVDELMASFATLTGVSGNTAEVSTQLAAIFTALIKPSSEASKMAQQMGIQFDAAAIKAAGGMKNFLTRLSADVKSYAATSGMLEQEVYGKLFGSAESLRAITPLVGNLADKFEENVNAMAGSAGTIDGAFETMGNTGSAQLQKLNNALGEYTDKLQGSIGNLMPYVNFASQMISTAASVGTLSSSLMSLGSAARSAAASMSLFGKSAAFLTGLSSAPLLAMAAGLAAVSAGYAMVKGQMEDTGRKAASLRSDLAALQQEHSNNTAALRQYLPVAQDATKKTSDRKDAIGKLKALYPDYFKNLDLATAKQYNIAKAVGEANKAYRGQLVLVAKQAKMQYEKSKANYEKNQNGGQMGGTNAGMNAMMNQQDKANVASDLKMWQEAEKAVRDYDKAMRAAPAATPAPAPASAPNIPAAPTTPKATSSSSGSGSGKTTTSTPAPATGSIDWYEKAIDGKRKELNATADTATAKVLNSQLEGLQRSLYMLKVKVGIETPPGSDIRNEIKPLAETVMESFEGMQERIRKNPLHVEVDEEGTKKLKSKLKDLEGIDMLGNTDLTSFRSVKDSLKSITEITDPTSRGFAAAGEAATALGGAMQQLGADSEAAKAGMVIAAVGQIVLSFAQALASCKTWVEWLAFGISGTAQMISLIATVSGFAKGGVVGGSSTTGDKIPVRVNSGEMILTKTQQARLFSIANGDYRPKMTLPDYSLPKLALNAASLGDLNRQGAKSQTVRFRLEGRSLVGALANETRVSSRSGRRSNIVI